MNDSLIVDLFWQRSEDALTVCADRFGAYCRKIAENVLNNGEDADEWVNETWLKAWNAIPHAELTILRAFLGKISWIERFLAYAGVNTLERKIVAELV